MENNISEYHSYILDSFSEESSGSSSFPLPLVNQPQLFDDNPCQNTILNEFGNTHSTPNRFTMEPSPQASFTQFGPTPQPLTNQQYKTNNLPSRNSQVVSTLPFNKTHIDGTLPCIAPQNSYILQPINEEAKFVGGVHVTTSERGQNVHCLNFEQEQRKTKRKREVNHWTDKEDSDLKEWVHIFANKRNIWAMVGKEMGTRDGKQCRERWTNHFRGDIKKDELWTQLEEEIIMDIHKREGTKWVKMSQNLVGRTESAIKNRWYATKRWLDRHQTARTPFERYILALPVPTSACYTEPRGFAPDQIAPINSAFTSNVTYGAGLDLPGDLASSSKEVAREEGRAGSSEEGAFWENFEFYSPSEERAFWEDFRRALE